MFISIICEYGIRWVINRVLYEIKLQLMRKLPFFERLFEKRIKEVKAIDLFEIKADSLEKCLLNLPECKKEKIITDADAVAQGKLIGFSHITLNYGNPINWQMNPITGQECDRNKKWYQIPDFDAIRGDIKLIWEASRFSQFILLARAYIITKDKKYFLTFVNQLSDWLKNNPYSYGANYKCGQECSIRMVNALMAYSAFSAFGCEDDSLDNDVKELICNMYRRVRSNFFYAHKCIKNDHTFSELMGIIVGAWCCNDKQTLLWAGRELNKTILDQFMQDGGYKMFSFNYEREVFQELERILSVKDKLGFELAENCIQRLKNAVLMMYNCQMEEGQLPNYGGNDGALVFPLTACEFDDYRPTLNTMYTFLFGKQLYLGGNYDEELFWSNIERSEVDDVDYNSNAYDAAGLFILRDCRNMAMIVLNDYKTRPSHMDQMHFELWKDKINLFCDAGTYSYVGEEAKWFAQSDAHNTLTIDNYSQMKIRWPFLIYAWTKRRDVIFDGHLFRGVMVSKNGYKHERQVLKCADGYVIVDVIDGLEGEKYRINYHTPCKVVINGNCANLFWNGEKIAEMRSYNKMVIEKASRSKTYLNKEDIECISIFGVLHKKTVVVVELKIDFDVKD